MNGRLAKLSTIESINNQLATEMLLTRYKRQPSPDSSECHRTRDDSKTSIEKTAPDMAPTAAPRTNPLSVSWPIRAPVMAPNKVPTAARKPFLSLFSTTRRPRL